MDQKEADEHMAFIERAVVNGDIPRLLGAIATGLLKVAAAQEAMLRLAQEDLDEQVEEVVRSRAETLAQEMDEEKTKRSYIGRK